MQATAFAGMSAPTAAIGGFLWEIANGDDGSPYAQICAVGAVAYLVAVAFLRGARSYFA